MEAPLVKQKRPPLLSTNIFSRIVLRHGIHFLTLPNCAKWVHEVRNMAGVDVFFPTKVSQEAVFMPLKVQMTAIDQSIVKRLMVTFYFEGLTTMSISRKSRLSRSTSF
jgi:hypothetical protein